MNPKLQKTINEIERAKAKISEFQAMLPALEKQKTELENAEIVKVFRSANVAPADFTAFIEAYKVNMNGGAPRVGPPAPQINRSEDMEDDKE